MLSLYANFDVIADDIAVIDKEETESIVVFHNKSEQLLQQSITSNNINITPELWSGPKRSVADIIVSAPGADINGQGGLFQSYNIRGFSRARIKTEVNGVPIISDRQAGNSISFIPPELIYGVYIQKGPSSSLYGSGAMGGVVSISTQNTGDSRVGATIQPQNDERVLYGELSIDEEENNALWNLGALYRKANNANTPDNEALNTQFEQMFATFSSDFSWNEIDIYFSTLMNQSNNIGKSSSEYPNNKISQYPQDDHIITQLEFTFAKQVKWKLFHHKQDWQTETSHLTEQLAISRTNITDYTSDTIGSFTYWQVENTRLGFEWTGRRNIKISETELDESNVFQWQQTSVNAEEDSLALYAFHTWNTPTFNTKIGARYDWVSIEQKGNTTNENDNKIDNFLSISLDTQFRINERSSLKAEIANSFRFPSVSELFYSGETPRGDTQGNSALNPEKSMGYQLGFQHQFSSELNVKISSYYYDIDDYIERYNVNDDLRSYRNTENVTIKGLEVITNWQVMPTLTSSVGLQLQSGKDRENKPIDDSLPNAVKWSVTWEFNQNITVINDMSYQFSQSDVGPSEQTRNDELIWHSKINTQLTPNMEVNIGIKNLTDNRYYASADEDAPLQPERTWQVNWQLLF